MKEVVVVSFARTPFGRYGGSLKNLSATELGGLAIEETLRRANFNPSDLDEVIMGTVVPAGQGQIPARQAAVKGGVPHSVPSLSINKVCGSSLKSIVLGTQMIKTGDADVVLVGGMESMTNTPYLSHATRWGARMNNTELVDAMVHDGLWCPDNNVHMAVIGGEVAKEYDITRELQDKWAARSQKKWQEAEEKGFFNEERFDVKVKDRRKEILVSKDEAPRPETTEESLSKLNPLFIKDGTITAGNAPGVNDGAACVLLMSKEKADELGLEVLATIKGYSQVAAESKYISTVPGLAIKKLVEKTNLDLNTVDVFEVNEAFAAVPLVSCMGILNMSYDEMDKKVNPNGGAVAVGHPIGATGSRIFMTLISQLRRNNLKTGVCSICSGMAQGDAVWIEVNG